ncbi:MAG: alpha/beta fold hydrolase, partial [Planctomycetota bacterium]
FIAAEELNRNEGFWWSPDSTKIAYVETDVSEVPIFRMPGLDERGTPVEQRYPRPGDPNAKWTLNVVGAGGGEPVTMEIEDEYLVDVAWWPDGTVYAQTAGRLQKKTWLVHAASGSHEMLLAAHESWADPVTDLHRTRYGWFWSSRGQLRAGTPFFRNEGLASTTTPREPEDLVLVVGVLAGQPDDVSEALQQRPPVIFTRRTGDALGIDLCVLDLLRKEEKTLRSGGWRSYEANEHCSRLVETASRAGEPPRITVIDVDGRDLVEIARGEPVPGLPKPEFFTIPAEDGTPLRAMLLRPAGKGRHPAILHCYGGPGAQMVADRWGGSNYLWHARMAQMGYAILTVDNRGSGGYGDKVMKSVHGRLLDLEVRDQTAAARWLGQQDFVDPKRIGIWGWSYGGTLSLMCLLRAPDVFAAAVAVASVTDWRDYDTAYTERYLGLPSENPQAYEKASPLTYAATLKRPLLLAHGISDDNVHFRHATAFVEAAQKAGAPVETDFYPRGAHGIGGPAERRLLFQRMEAFWEAHLTTP